MNMNKIKNYFSLFYLSLIVIVSIAGCKSAKRQKQIPPLFLPTCSLPNVKNCVTQCEVVNGSKNIAIQQELASGINLSHFNLAACAGQFELIYNCYLQSLGKTACATLDNIIQTDNFKLVLENPNCQCNTLFS